MFQNCAFCNGKLAGDGGPSGLGVGRRFAYDEWKGRLWVICSACGRWNLTPLDDRLERIEALARVARDGRVVATTEQISLIRWGAYDLVRVGKPPRVEFATWRYGERLKARQRERLKYVIPIGLAAVGLVVAVNVALGGSVGGFAWQFSRLADGTYVWLVGNRLVTLAEPPICERCGSVLHLRARHIQQARLVPHAHEDLALVVTCPKCGSEATMLTGDDAGQALRQGLTYLNTKGKRKKAADAARVVDAAGGPDQLIRDTSRRELTLRSLASERRLALEMSLDEAAEVRELERRWREAEEIAEIADGTLSTDPRIEEELKRLRQRDDGRPPQA